MILDQDDPVILELIRQRNVIIKVCLYLIKIKEHGRAERARVRIETYDVIIKSLTT